MWLLVTLLLAQNVLAEGTRTGPSLTMKIIESCPDVGYFFQRQSAPNSFQQEACYLCFCRDNGTAACWLRENRRCKEKHYQHYGYREKRVRRYAKGFSDIFFRDAAKELFQKQAPQECKPFESSKSYGCPPDDWCLGCTVCDCDAAGHWDCHVMSFCPDKKKIKNNKNTKRNFQSRRNDQIRKLSTTTNSEPVPGKMKITTQKPEVPRAKKAVRKKNKVTTPRAAIKKVNVTTRKPNSVRVRTVFLMKNSTTKYPMSIKGTQVKFFVKPYNSTVKLAQKVPKRFVTVIHRKNNGTQYNNNDTIVGNKFVQKRAALKTNQIKGLKKSVVRNDNKNKSKISIVNRKSIKKPDNKSIVVQNVTANMPKINVRRKRDTLAVEDLKFGLNTAVNDNGSSLELGTESFKNSFTYRKIHCSRMTHGTFCPEIPLINAGLKYTSPDELGTVVTNSGNVNTTSSNFKTPTPLTTIMETFYTTDFYNNNTKWNSSDSFNTKNIQIFTLKTKEDDFKNYTSKETNYVDNKVAKDTDVLDGMDIEIKKNNNATLNIANYTVNNTLSKTYLISNKMNVSKIRINKEDINKNMVEKDVYQFKNQTRHGFENKIDSGHLNSSQIKLMKHEMEKSHFTHNQTKLPNRNKTDPLTVVNNNTRDIATLDNKKTRKNKLINKSKRYKVRRIIEPNFNSANKRREEDRPNNLQTFLQNFLNVFPIKKNTTEENLHVKSFNILKYLKKIIRYIFSKSESKRITLNSKHINKRVYDVNIIALLCEYFGPCQIKSKYKVILKSKLIELNTEMTKIIKTIGIIKGLLRLINLPNNYISAELIDEDINVTDDVNKLKSILKGTYDNTTLSETQISQIEYVKNNTKQCINSISKFATVLNEIIKILTNKNKERYKIDTFRNLRPMRRKHNIIRNEKKTLEDTLNSLKNILIKYNVVQNTFIRNMYGIINNFESKLNISKKKPEVAVDKKVNNTEAIEAYAKNIIKNLRKLKDIANKLNDKNSRHKREAARDNDGLEYLLTMMEYMIKQNYPLDMVPANDGIDLLIDAIRNAPDIKPIQKKVLKYITKTKFTTTTEEAKLINFEEDSSNSIDKSKENNITSQVDEVKGVDDKTIVFSDTDYEDLKVYSTLTQKPIVNKEDNLQLLEEEPVMEPHTHVVTKASVTNNMAEENLFNFEKTLNRGSDFYDVRRYDVFQADMEDDVTVIYKTTTEYDTASSTEVSTESTPVANTPSVKTVTLEKVTSNDKTTKKFSFIENSEESEERLSSDKRSKADWIDEGDLWEVTVNMSITTAQPTKRDPSTEKTNVLKNQNISAISKELVDEEMRNSKIQPDDVVFMKEMDLLNSLDYGTEKSEMEDNESKDGLPDRYSGDYF